MYNNNESAFINAFWTTAYYAGVPNKDTSRHAFNLAFLGRND